MRGEEGGRCRWVRGGGGRRVSMGEGGGGRGQVSMGEGGGGREEGVDG